MGNNKYRSKKKAEAAIQVFEHYAGGSPACATCGAALAVTGPFCVIAVGEDAKALRQQFRNRVGATFYPIIVREGYPEGFEIRCDTCMHGPDFQQVSSKGMNPRPTLVGLGSDAPSG